MRDSWKYQYIDLNGNLTLLTKESQGPPIIFLHGWSLNTTYWKQVAEYFANHGYQIYAYDWRGNGGSEGGASCYPFSDLVVDLKTVIDRFGIDKPVLCGHSAGGDISLEFGVTYPDSISAIVAADPPGIQNLVTSRISYFFLNLALRLLGFLFPNNPLRLLAPFFGFLFYSKDFRKGHPEAMDAWRKQFFANSTSNILNSERALATRENIKKKLTQMQLPTLLIRGSEDLVVPQREMEQYHKLIPNSELEIIEGSGHMTLVEAPEDFIKIMGSFLDRLPES